MREMSFTVGGSSTILESTLISIVPFPIHEFKPGLIPGIFEIPASVNGVPQFKVIGESHHFVYIDAERGQLRVLDPSYEVADSIVADYNSAQLEAEPGAHPGLFWALGRWDAEKVKKDPILSQKMEEIRQIQLNWFVKLVRLADDDWEKTRTHMSISDVQRYAVKEIDPQNKQGRQWIFVAPTSEPVAQMVVCPSCGSDVASTAVVCRYCKYIIDQARYAQMKFAGDSTAGFNLKTVMEHQSIK